MHFAESEGANCATVTYFATQTIVIRVIRRMDESDSGGQWQ